MTPDAFWAAEMQNRRLQQEQQQYDQEVMAKAMASIAGTYANNKALDAKGAAYGDFLGKHGEQLGFDPEYLEELKKKKPRELAMIGDNIIGMQNTGNRLMGLNSMQYQANLYGGRGTGGGGGGAGDYVVGQGWQ
jgi:hypothetical protein